jgi:hypothetical protein
MRVDHAALLLAAAVLVGCNSAITPFSTVPQAAPAGATDPGPRVAICYNTFKSSAAQIQEAAQAECLNGGTAELIYTDYRLDFCPLATPGRATFICKPKPKPKG